MRICEKLKRGIPTLSFEVFPPKPGLPLEPTLDAVRRVAALRPDFISVTYGAGGNGAKGTVALAREVQNGSGVTALAHLTCVGSTKEDVAAQLAELKKNGIENVLALRGDLPAGEERTGDFRYAADLVSEIRATGDFCIGAACYPEGHIECPHREDDIAHLKMKVDRGVDFLTTQMFFDNSVMYSFLYRAMARGIDVPVIAGIMPVTNGRMIARACALSGATLPNRFRRIVDRYGEDPDAMKQAGIAYATEQIVDLLANGVRGIHVYTMNKPDVAQAISENLSYLIPGNGKN
ncbi:MAG: methylenetetrahydrofolate reductase [NAD(P)H] [Clostridia bacterium]|nr:methylenetetrahydrofolate reductase [NAD(P)H] [Clostridia bacterium]